MAAGHGRLGLRPFLSEIRGDTLYVTGYIDEHSDFSRVKGAFGNVSLQNVEGFSSIGLRQFLNFLYAHAAGPVALLECPVSFIETINVISGLLRGTKVVIESLLVPFRCPNCLVQVEILTRCAEVTVAGSSIKLPTPRCHKCPDQLRLHVDPHEYFLFLYG